MPSFTSEAEFEKNIINQLIQGESQWTYRNDLKTEDQLWDNFRQILEANNVSVLDGVPLTDQEFEQVKAELNFSSFYAAAVWLTGENGVAKATVQREDASKGTIILQVIRRQDIAGGTSVYEVINQYRTTQVSPVDRQRIFDVTLLINGLPMIHIELKNKSDGYMSAYEQINKYLNEGKFNGIYSTTQMFVVTNGSDTRYIAAGRGEKLNSKFLTNWVDKDNKRVNNYLEFTEHVLSIPHAHKLVTQFTVIDNEKKSLILLRPYQIHAIEAVERASRRRESGYVWHTTGSGKTLTSYKVARNLLQIPSIDKTIFIVDRIDLDQQTTASFTSYAENDVIDIDQTDNVSDLVKKLVSNDRILIVTTIQKLNYVMKRYGDNENNRNYKKLQSLNVAFVVDECHRAVSPEKQQEINKFFPYALWYGFTGTPLFVENARQEQGNLARTTEEQYGPRLHEYTVKEAINDNAVLGFQVEYNNTISDDDLIDIVKHEAKVDSVLHMDEVQKEKYIPTQIYCSDEHKLEVIDTIINHSKNKFNLDQGIGNTYSAILTTSSIKEAQRYYDLFREVIESRSSVVISDKVKKAVVDFPKVSVTYSVTETEESSFENQSHLKGVIEDYNKMYNTNYDLSNLRGFNRNLNDRLARKKEIYKYREEQIDIVIVVDRLLTGFDAPSLALLFVDRQPMRPQGLIQAFSRTNRIYDHTKQYGQIMTFQSPATFKEAVQEAFLLYSNGGENAIQAPDWDEAFSKFTFALEELRFIAPNPDNIDMNDETEALKLFVKNYQQFDKTFSAIKAYSNYDEYYFREEFGLKVELIEDYHGKYENALQEIKERIGENDVEEILFDIDYKLSSIGTDKIDYEYLILLIQNLSNERYNQKDDKPSKKRVNEIEKYISDFKQTNPKLAVIIDDIWNEIQHLPKEELKNLDVSQKLQLKIEEKIDTIEKKITKEYFLNKEDFAFLVENYNPAKKKQIGETELKRSADYNAYKENTENGVNRLKFWKHVKNEFTDVIEEEILPLNWR